MCPPNGRVFGSMYPFAPETLAQMCPPNGRVFGSMYGGYYGPQNGGPKPTPNVMWGNRPSKLGSQFGLVFYQISGYLQKGFSGRFGVGNPYNSTLVAWPCSGPSSSTIKCCSPIIGRWRNTHTTQGRCRTWTYWDNTFDPAANRAPRLAP